jgi:hypothetical protein
MLSRGIELIGVPANSSGTDDRVARAPAALRERGLSAMLASRPGFTDSGDLPLPPPLPWRGPSGLLAEDALITMINKELDPRLRAALPRVRAEHVIAVGPVTQMSSLRPAFPAWQAGCGHRSARPASPALTARPPGQPETSFLRPGGCTWIWTCWDPDPDRTAADAIISYLAQAALGT